MNIPKGYVKAIFRKYYSFHICLYSNIINLILILISSLNNTNHEHNFTVKNVKMFQRVVFKDKIIIHLKFYLNRKPCKNREGLIKLFNANASVQILLLFLLDSEIANFFTLIYTAKTIIPPLTSHIVIMTRKIMY